MKKASYLSINFHDVVKAVYLTFITTVLTWLSQQLNVGHIPTWAEWRVILITGVTTFLGYMIKNFLTNSKDQFLKEEIKY